jgi:hypothetical protein
MKRQSPYIIVLSLILLISAAAGFTATNESAYLVIMVTAALGGLAGLVIASEEDAQERELLEFKQRLNNRK